jgi:NADH dehydrogenase
VKVLVTGASGFVGKAVTTELVRQGHTVLAASRRGSELPGAQNLALDVTERESCEAIVQAEPDALIHLVGIIAERGEQTFERVHRIGTENVLKAAGALPKTVRYLQMSALGADLHSASAYFRTKAQAEEAVRSSRLDWTIFQPSLIFGPGDEFFGKVLRQLVSGPLVPLIGDGHFPFRPVWVGDVALAFVQALQRPACLRRTFPLVGPKEYSFRELLELELRALKMPNKALLPIPLAAMRLAVPLMQLLPRPPITRDQYAMLIQGNTGNPEPASHTFDLPLRSLEEVLPELLSKVAR